MTKKIKKLVVEPADQFAIMSKVAYQQKVENMREGRVQRAHTFGGPKNRRKDRRNTKADLRNY